MRDDLDDLQYLPPEGMKAAHTLAIRIINLDTDDGATLAVFDFPVAAPASRTAARDVAVEAAPDPEMPRLREECAKMRTALGLREKELADARQALEAARTEVLSQDGTFASARSQWQSELDARLAQAHVEATSRLEAGRATWFSELNTRIEESRARWQREAEVALTRAKEAWRAEEASRLAQVESHWREQSAHALAEAKAKTDRAESALTRAEAEAARMSGDGAALRRLREEIAEANAALTARARELAEVRQSLEQARSEGLKGKSELAAARAAWQAEMERRLAAIRAEATANRDVSDLENHAQNRIEQAREQWRQEAEAALSRAMEDWKSDDAVRLARAEAQWREQSARALAESAARLEKAETALARAQARALHETSDTVELRRVRDELLEVRTVLADRETRLAQVRLETKRARERWKAESDVALKNAQEAWKAEEAYRISVARGDWQRDFRVANDDAQAADETQSRNTRRLVLDGFLAAALAVAVVVLYPTVAPTLAQYWPAAFSGATVNASVATRMTSQPPTVALRPAPAAPRTDVTIHAANVHEDPSATGAVVATLARGIKVTPIEQRGSWVRVHAGDGSQAKDGWVYGPYLKETAGS
jgi:hypothetical protein